MLGATTNPHAALSSGPAVPDAMALNRLRLMSVAIVGRARRIAIPFARVVKTLGGVEVVVVVAVVLKLVVRVPTIVAVELGI